MAKKVIRVLWDLFVSHWVATVVAYVAWSVTAIFYGGSTSGIAVVAAILVYFFMLGFWVDRRMRQREERHAARMS